MIEAEDGALIRVDSQGLRHGPPEVMAALLRGEKVDSTQVYFRTVIRFETAALAHDDLNLRLFLATGERQHDCVILRLTELGLTRTDGTIIQKLLAAIARLDPHSRQRRRLN